MDENNRNFLMAIILSIAVLLAWQAFYNGPKTKQREALKQLETQQQQARQKQQGAPAAQGDQPAIPQPAASGAPPKPEPRASGIPSAAPTPAGTSRKSALAASPRIALETSSLIGSIALTGARIDDLVMTRYRETADPASPAVTLFSPSGSSEPFYAEHGWVSDGAAKLKLPAADTQWTASSQGGLKPGSPVTLEWDNGEGLIFRRTISVDKSYMFTVRQEVENNTGTAVTLFPYALISRHGRPKVQSFYILHEGLVGVLGSDGLQEIDYEDAIEDKLTSFKNITGGWLGITDKYWGAVVIPDQKTPYQGRFSGSVVNSKERFQADYLGSAVQIPAGGKASVQGLLFAGAKEVDVVDASAETYKIDRFDLLIDWGWFYFLTKPLFFALDYFFKLVGNFGLAILLVTVLIKLVLFPLANKSYVSMSKMKKLQPEMTRIKERFGDDKTRQQQALMDLYKKEKVNPASGCLPIVVQIPVFFALYKVLFVTIEMRHAPFYGWIKDLSAPDPTTIFNLFGLIPFDPPGFLMIGIWPLIMGLTMFVQMRLNPAPPDPIQAKIFAWMPVMFTFLLAPFPAGLVIYWAWNNILSVLQQAFIMKRQGVPITLFENIGVKKKQGAHGKS
ncbi:MAG: membrane protein insertase YidC [Methyloligellaceae bacterium]